MLLMALYLAHKKTRDTQRMYIFVPQELLQLQTKKIFDSHHLPNDYKVMTLADLTLKMANGRHEDTVYLLDEGDLYIKSYLIAYNKKERVGLNAMIGKKTYLFTATLSPYWKKCVRNLFKIGLSSIIEVKTVQEAFTQTKINYDAKGFEYPSES